MLLATSLTPQVEAPATGFFDSGVGYFLTSPGAGGLAVLLAAIITGVVAYRASRRASSDNQDRLDLEREQARQDRWWETLRWTFDRATDARREARLSPDIVMSLVEALGDQAQTDIELTAAISVLDRLDDGRASA